MSIHSTLIQKLLTTNSHIGRRTTAHHFKIFSEGTRNSVSIIDADKTLICLRNACNFIGHLSRSNARFLFVNTNPIFDEIIAQMTKRVSIKNDTTWRLGGFLTNSLSPKKFKGRNKRLNLNAIVPPDCVVIFDTENKSSVIKEAWKLQIPIVGLVDSSMGWETFKKITYPVPANDSVEFVYLFCNLITKTILKERGEVVEDEEKAGLLSNEAQKDEKIVGSDKILVFPYEKLPAVSEDVSEAKQLLDKLVVLKFNGKLGTKFGYNGPNCAMDIGGDLTCLDLIVNNIEALNTKYGCDIPVLLVNAVNTHDGVLKVLEKHSNKNIHSVIQGPPSQESTSNFTQQPAKRQNKQDEMDSFNLLEVFLPLMKSGKLDVLISQGKEYILLLSSDNVAHIVDPKILNHMVQNNIDYCLEVMPKDSESEDSSPLPSKEDTTQIPTSKKQWKFVNTSWMNINSIVGLLARRAAMAKESVPISELFNQFALSVPKLRHLPVESTSELFLLQSDLYSLTDGSVIRNTARRDPEDPSVEFGPEEFQNVDDFKMRFKSIPSVVELDTLEVSGDVWFGTGITLKGSVSIHARYGAKIVIPDNATLANTVITSQRDIGGGSL